MWTHVICRHIDEEDIARQLIFPMKKLDGFNMQPQIGCLLAARRHPVGEIPELKVATENVSQVPHIHSTKI